MYFSLNSSKLYVCLFQIKVVPRFFFVYMSICDWLFKPKSKRAPRSSCSMCNIFLKNLKISASHVLIYVLLPSYTLAKYINASSENTSFWVLKEWWINIPKLYTDQARKEGLSSPDEGIWLLSIRCFQKLMLYGRNWYHRAFILCLNLVFDGKLTLREKGKFMGSNQFMAADNETCG